MNEKELEEKLEALSNDTGCIMWTLILILIILGGIVSGFIINFLL